jgi:hypothetical protein
MKKLPLIMVTLVLAAGSVFADSYYQSDGMFSLRPKSEEIINPITRFGPVGISIDLIQPAFTMRIKAVESGSPAARTGQLKPGLFIKTINGQPLKNIDPRIQLGNIITKAEATDGKVILEVADKPKGPAREVVVQIPVLGAYSDTWPIDCPKSDKIVRGLAEHLKKSGSSKGFADIGMLFLLSTGDESDLAYVRKWARAHKGNLGYPWHVGYGGLALCEYYLRTGDEQVLPTIQKIADHVVKMENFGGWGGRGAMAGVDYGGGGGHVNAAGGLVPAYLFLAKECGAKMPDDVLRRVAGHWIRWSGRGNVAYGNARPEAGFTENGRNGKLAFSMAAAASLTPEGEKSIYAKARDVSASFSFYSTSYMLHGHTGGGIGEVTRSSAMGLLREKMPNQYRDFMDQRRWHYDISRRFNGAFAILGGERYDNEEWGVGYALTYTVPRKTLRLTGAPPTEHSKPFKLPAQPWGTAEDNDFQSIQPIAYPDGTLPDISDQTVADDTAYPLHRKMRSAEFDEQAVGRLVRSPNWNLRRDAATKFVPKYGPPMLKQMLESDDARLRRTGLEAALAAPDKLFVPEIRQRVIAMIEDPDESWYVKDAAIQLVGHGPQDWMVAQVDLILPYLEHEEWWLQVSALDALSSVVNDKRCYQKVLTAVGKMAQTNHLYKVVSPFRWGKMAGALKKADAQVQAVALANFKNAYTQYQPYEHELESVEKNVNNANLDVFADVIAAMPGGYNELFALAKKRFPDQTLPYREMFLQADPKDLGPELKKQVNTIIEQELIPAHIKNNRGTLEKEIASNPAGRGALSGLVFLYQRMGVHKYDWENFGPDRGAMTWWYHSFDPPEKWEGVSDRLGRYRPVTFPQGMDKWFTLAFDPKQAGWKQGLAPFGAADGKKGRIAGDNSSCTLPFCGCSKPINTLWENDVLLIRGKFKIPPLEAGYRYRLLHGGISHVGSGGGYRLYVNGKLFDERKNGTDRRGGGVPIGKVITKEWWSDFNAGEVTLAAITFKKHHPRTKKFGGNVSFFLQRMKNPPLDQ